MNHPLPPNRFTQARVFAAPVVLLAALALAGCSDGGGDPDVTPVGSELGTCQPLDKLVGPATWINPGSDTTVLCPTIPADHNACLSGVTLVAIDSYDETGDGATGNYYVETTTNDPQPYSGITVFGPSFSPPDLRVAENDVVDVVGIAEEFPGPNGAYFPDCRTLPEMAGTMSFRFDGSTGVPPVVVTAEQLSTYDGARPYLGMLVKVENVQLGTSSSSKGRYAIGILSGGTVSAADQPKIANELFDLPGTVALTAGQTIKSVTGVVSYFYGFHVNPRSAADIEM